MNMFHKFFGRENASSTAKKSRNSLVNLSIEPLEERQMLAITSLIGGAIASSVAEGQTAQLALTVESDAAAALGITVKATTDSGKLDPAAIRLLGSDGKEISSDKYLYDVNGTDSSTVIVKLPKGSYQIQVKGDDGTYGSFTCDVFLPGLEKAESTTLGTGSGTVTKLDGLRSQAATAQGTGNYNEQTVAYYNALASSLGYAKKDFDATKSQYRSWYDYNDDMIVSGVESSWVTVNAQAGKVTASLNSTEAMTVTAGVTNWLVSDTATAKTKTAVLDISGTATTNVVKLEAIFDGTGASTTWTDITSKLGTAVEGVKPFQLDAATLNKIYYGNDTGKLAAGTYTIKFRATGSDEKQTPLEISYTFTLVDHTQPVSKAPETKTLDATSTDSSVEWNAADLVETPGTTFSYRVFSVVAYDTTYTFSLNTAKDGYDPIEIKNGDTVMGTLTYTGGTKGADGNFYGGKLVFKPTAAQVALSKGAADIALTFKFIVQDDSATTANKTDGDKSINVTVHPVNKTPVVNLTAEGVKKTFDPNAAEYTYKLSGTADANSAVIATDANTADKLSYNYAKMAVTVGGSAVTATGGENENKVWTTAQGTVITLVWDAESSSYTQLKVKATTSATATAESISIKFTVMDNAGVTTAANGDQVSETAEQTLALTVNGISAKPTVVGADLTITAAQAQAGTIATGWQATGTGITKYEIGVSTTSLQTITVGGTATISGIGTFRLESDGKLTWVTVDPAFIPAAGAANKVTDFVFQATNADGTTTHTGKFTVTAESTIVFSDQSLYIPTNGTAVEGKMPSGGAITSTYPTGTTVVYTVESAKDKDGTTVDATKFTIGADNHILVNQSDLESLNAGPYVLVVKATYSGGVTETKTANVTLHIEAGTAASVETKTTDIGEKATAAVDTTEAVSGLASGVDWAMVANSKALDGSVQVSAHGSTVAYPHGLTAKQIEDLLAQMTIARDGSTNNIKATFTPNTAFNELFQFLSEGQTATLVFTYKIREDRFGLISTGTINIRVVGKNDTPVANATVDTGTTIDVNSTEGKKITIASILQSDPDLADKHFVMVPQNQIKDGTADKELKADGDTVTLLSGATLTYKADAENGDYLLYLPNGGESTSSFYSAQKGAAVTDTFELYVKDDSGATDATAVAKTTVTVHLTGVNKTPTFNNTDPIDETATEKATTTFTLDIAELATDPNTGDIIAFGTIEGPDGTKYTVDTTKETEEFTSSTGSIIRLTNSGKTLTIIPKTTTINLRQFTDGDLAKPELENVTWRTETYKFTVKDNQGVETGTGKSESDATKTVKLTVTGLNDTPVASDIAMDVQESAAFAAWSAKDDITGWLVIDWRTKIYDPDVNETDMLTFKIDGYGFDADGQIAFPDGTFSLTTEEGKLVLRFRPKSNYSNLVAGENVTLSHKIQVTDPAGATSPEVKLDITIKGESTTPNVGTGIQTFYVSTIDPLEAFRTVKFFTDAGDATRPTVDATKTTGGSFKGFSLDENGKILITPDADLEADFASLADGAKIVYTVYFTYDDAGTAKDAGYVKVSIVKGEAPETVEPTEYILTLTEKYLTDKDHPYTPIDLPAGYTIDEINEPAASSKTDPTSPVSEAALADAISKLEEGVHYGLNDDGRFYFDPKQLFYFLKQDQKAEIDFTITLLNEYGLPDGGVVGKITVVVTGVNDRPEAKSKEIADADAVWANSAAGTQVKVADLFTDYDVDDTHSIIVIQEGQANKELKADGDTITLASGAKLTYKANAVDGDYLLYEPNGAESGIFYSLQSKAILADALSFMVKDNSNMANAESTNTATLTFKVKGVNKTPEIINDKLNQTVGADGSVSGSGTTGLTLNASDLATDANTGDILSFDSIKYGDTTWTTGGAYEIHGAYKGVDDALLGTLTIAADMKSFTFLPNSLLLNDDEDGLTPYDPNDSDSFLNLNFEFVVKDNQGIVDDPIEGKSDADAATLKLQIQGVSVGPRLRDPDFEGSIANNSGATLTQLLDASQFFSGKNVKFTSATVPQATIDALKYDDDGNPRTFLQNIKSITVDANGKIEVVYMPETQYIESYDLSPVTLVVTVEDEDGASVEAEIRLNCEEQYTTKVYLRPVRASEKLDPLDFNAPLFPENYETEYDGKDGNTFNVNVGEDYYLQIWARDDATELLKRIETVGLSYGVFDMSYNKDVGEVLLNSQSRADIQFIDGYSTPNRGTFADAATGSTRYLNGIGCGAPQPEDNIGHTLGLNPKGWVVVQIHVKATAAGSPDFALLLDSLDLTVDRYKPDEMQQKSTIHTSQIQIVNPTIVHNDPGSPLTALAQQDKEVDGGIYMRTVTSPTTTLADGTVASLPKDADMLHEWQTHYVELWVKASEADQYIAAKTDLHYDSRYFTATNVELGKDFRYGNRAVIDDAAGLVSGIGGASAGSVSKDGYILLGRVRFESIGTDNVPWSESTVPHSLGLKLDNGGVRMSEGYWVSKLGSGSNTELWANPFDYNDDGVVGVVDFTAFTREFMFRHEDELTISPFNVSRSGQMSVTDFTTFTANFNVKREDVAAGNRELKLHANYTKRYIGSTLQTDNRALVGTMLDAANQAWADALGLDKPIDVTLVVKDFGDSTTLGEAQITAIGTDGLPSAGIITLDDDAAGLGWYSQIAEPVHGGKYDLYTTLLHELGHIYGINEAYAAYNAVKSQFNGELGTSGHVLDSTDVMYEGLNTGQRKYLSDLDVNLVETIYGKARGNSALHGFSTAPSRLEALGERIVTEIPAADLPVETVITTFAADAVLETTAQISIPVAKESVLPTVLKTEANAKTLAELNTMGLDVSLPQVTPNYSAAANADLIVGELWADDAEEDEFDLTAPATTQAASSELLDQLIGEMF